MNSFEKTVNSNKINENNKFIIEHNKKVNNIKQLENDTMNKLLIKCKKLELKKAINYTILINDCVNIGIRFDNMYMNRYDNVNNYMNIGTTTTNIMKYYNDNLLNLKYLK
jgi:hypothetical protein